MLGTHEEKLTLEKQWEHFQISLDALKKQIMEAHLEYLTKITCEESSIMAEQNYDKTLKKLNSLLEEGKKITEAFDEKAALVQSDMTDTSLIKADELFRANKSRWDLFESQEKFKKSLDTATQLFLLNNTKTPLKQTIFAEDNTEPSGLVAEEASLFSKYPHQFSIWNTPIAQYLCDLSARLVADSQYKLKRS